MKMKKGLLIAFITCCFFSSISIVSAQEAADGRFAYNQSFVEKYLDLSEAQASKIHQIRYEHKENIYKIVKQISDVRHQIGSLKASDPYFDVKIKRLARKHGQLTEKAILERAYMLRDMYMILTPEQRHKLVDFMNKTNMNRYKMN
ncbi:MAG: hypothetical protein D6732_17270 [Methanobacteriota archaeon]|nr:MAG: hypothetical protein D6732_17270 [Euryarchaeota archaeon]